MVDWKGIKRRSWSSDPLCTQSLAADAPSLKALGWEFSKRTLTGPASSSAFKSSHPLSSTWSVMSLYPLGISAPFQMPPLPEPEPAPSASDSSSEASFSITALSSVGFAPWTLWMTLPLRNKRKVGRAVMPYSCARSWLASLSILTKVRRFGREICSARDA